MVGAAGYDRMKEVKKFDNSKMGVKGLSDSGITTIPKFFVHRPETLSDLRKPSLTGVGIPVIDLSNVNTETGRVKVVGEIREAAKTWGFFQLVNHCVPVPVLDDTIAAIKAFHDRPLEEKAKYYVREEGRGVMYASNFDLHRSTAACWHDSLNVWMAPDPAAAEEIPAVCRRAVAEWDIHAKKVAEDVMELLCEGVGLKGGKLKELGCCDTRAIVGHCYPPCPQPDLTVGIKSHTDPGVLTVLLQNQVGGLQVKHGEDWVDVKPIHGGLIINIGDLLQIISNGEYNSVQHRVLANGSKEDRISIVEFFNVDKYDESARYGPLPELVSRPEKPCIYRNFTMKEFTENFYSKGLDSKSFVEKLKLCA